jgi:hypothetical protein
MDKFVSIGAFPIGLIVCFGAAILFWLKMELDPSAKDRDKTH